MMKSGIIVQARCGSSRLPNKMFLPFSGQRGILQILLENIKESIKGETIVLATTNSVNDDRIAELGFDLGIDVFRGSEENVIQRFIDAATYFNLDNIIRVCADNPFLDMGYLNKLIIHQKEMPSLDYISYITNSGIPTIKTHYGFWAEGVSLTALKKVANLTSSKLYQEHVTNYIYTYRQSFNIDFIPIPKEIEVNNLRMTIDTEDDYFLLKDIYKSYRDLKTSDLMALVNMIKSNSEWLKIMENQINYNTK